MSILNIDVCFFLIKRIKDTTILFLFHQTYLTAKGFQQGRVLQQDLFYIKQLEQYSSSTILI